MPELPEVESLRRSLEPYIVGQVIQSVEVLKPKLVSAHGTVRGENHEKVREFERELRGQEIQSIQRIAKNLLIHMVSGKVLLIHLKMTGQLVYQEGQENKALGGHPIQASETELPNKHSHILFTLSNGTLYYNDVRMFGYLLYYPDVTTLRTIHAFDQLGMEPLSEAFDLTIFRKELKRRKRVLKSALLAQDIVVGLGNIYVDEACFRAGIQPHRVTNTLSDVEIESLYQSIQYIIPRAVQQGGSSVANYIMADGSRGTYAREHAVYGRGGKPCLVCGTPLVATKIHSRTTVSCPLCQA